VTYLKIQMVLNGKSVSAERHLPFSRTYGGFIACSWLEIDCLFKKVGRTPVKLENTEKKRVEY
jgi:hypothetical protein